MAMRTLHARMSDDLRIRLEDEVLSPGEVLPSEAELEQAYEVSRITIRTALRAAAEAGPAIAQSGRRRIVRARQHMVSRPQREKEHRLSPIMVRFMAGLSQKGQTPSRRIDIAVDHAHGVLARRFEAPEKTPVVVRKTVRSVDNEPLDINDMYYLHSVAKHTAVMSPTYIPHGSDSLIEDVVGREVTALHEFYVRMPTPAETKRLRLSPGTPVAVHYPTGYTGDDKVVRVEYFVLPGDRHVITCERNHPKADQ